MVVANKGEKGSYSPFTFFGVFLVEGLSLLFYASFTFIPSPGKLLPTAVIN